MIDTTDAVALERALTYCQGKSIINSINLEDGLEKFERREREALRARSGEQAGRLKPTAVGMPVGPGIRKS